MHSHVHKADLLNKRRPPLAAPPAPAATPIPTATPAGSFYDRTQSGPLLTPATFRPPAAAARESQVAQQRKQLNSRIAALQRELQPIETELATLRRQLLTLN
jgi:septal ring factor EnvC (AmiA/AmiB activator)